jgi:protein phosphatase
MRRLPPYEVNVKPKRTPPRDVIGDVEGCYYELLELIEKLGYTLVLTSDRLPRVLYAHAPGRRKLVFAGDLLNRGPHPDLVINLVMQLVKRRIAIAVLGNQEKKYMRFLEGKLPAMPPEVRVTVATIDSHGEQFRSSVYEFLNSLPYLYETDRLIVVHGAYREDADEKTAKTLALWGETDGSLDHRGQRVRLTKWETDYRGTKTIVHGHTAVCEPTRRDLPSGARIFNVDTSAAFGGKLTALRFPTLQLVHAKSRAAYVPSWSPCF